MGECLRSILFLLFFIRKVKMSNDAENFVNGVEPSASAYVYWPQATIPFYIVPEHFDREQSNSIMTTLALFSFKTCLKFVPVLTPPEVASHVLVFANPEGVRKCVISTEGHSMEEPHTVILGYGCLQSPDIDMMVMKALGFPFEHNRASRDLFIDVLFENIEPSAMELYTKDIKLPLELRSLAYDVDSVMHFGDRAYSKNGHRTIIFKDYLHSPVKQNRHGLSPLDLRKIDLVYGPECRKRDRQEKVELCQNYPGVARRKRQIEPEVNLRVNRDITPPPPISVSLNESLKELGVEDEVQDVVDHVYKVSARALRNARAKYCNVSRTELRVSEEKVPKNKTNPDLLGIIEAIANYALNVVENAVANLTLFCQESENFELYQRARCPFYESKNCPMTYRSTKSGPVRHSTQHRPVYIMSTKHVGNPNRNRGYVNLRSKNETESNTTDGRKKRDVETTTKSQATGSGSGRRDDDVTRVVNPRSRDDDPKYDDVEGRREATRVINLRSKDDEPTTAGSSEDAKKRQKRLVEASTTSGKGRKDDSNVNKEAAKTPSSASRSEKSKSDAVLRAGTMIPGGKQVAYVAEWPSPSRHHRRINKLRKRPITRPKSSSESTLSLENKESLDQSETEIETTVTSKKKSARHKQLKTTKKAKKSRPLRQKEYSEETEKLMLPKPDSDSSAERGDSLPPITVELSKANKEFYAERKWPDGVIRYVLVEHPEYDMVDVRRRLAEVNNILMRETCAKLEEITEAQARKYQDYLVVDTGADFVTGRVGGRQHFGCLELFRGGQHRQHAAMVVMAMLGFYFELSRHDRDKFVRVHLRHVRPDKLHHFEKIRSDATFPLTYDFASATQPAWQFWRKIGKTGISTVATYKSRDPTGDLMKSLGQNEALLSELDLVKINSVYGTKCFQKRQRHREKRQ